MNTLKNLHDRTWLMFSIKKKKKKRKRIWLMTIPDIGASRICFKFTLFTLKLLTCSPLSFVLVFVLVYIGMLFEFAFFLTKLLSCHMPVMSLLPCSSSFSWTKLYMKIPNLGF